MAKKALIAATVVVATLIGVYLGSISATLKESKQYGAWNQRRDQLQVRSERDQPTCAQLKRVGEPTLVVHGNDRYIVDVQADYFYVFGINTDPGQPPVTAWWGGGLKAAQQQACK